MQNNTLLSNHAFVKYANTSFCRFLQILKYRDQPFTLNIDGYRYWSLILKYLFLTHKTNNR